MSKFKVEKKIRLAITLSKAEMDMLERLVNSGQGSNYSTGVGSAINVAYNKNFPPYTPRRNGLSNEPLTAEEKATKKAEQKIADKEAITKAIRDRGVNFCTEVLRGTVDGTGHCTYPTLIISRQGTREKTEMQGGHIDTFNPEHMDMNEQVNRERVLKFNGGMLKLIEPYGAWNALMAIEKGNLSEDDFHPLVFEEMKKIAKTYEVTGDEDKPFSFGKGTLTKEEEKESTESSEKAVAMFERARKEQEKEEAEELGE